MAGYRKLGRPTAHRSLMLRNLVTSLIKNGRIETTETRAKEARKITDKMITLGKRGDLHARRQAMAFITEETVVKTLFDEIAPKYADKSGGYTRIYKLGPRRGDAAPMVLIELI
jgi:large subunit ribosomal protein L17